MVGGHTYSQRAGGRAGLRLWSRGQLHRQALAEAAGGTTRARLPPTTSDGPLLLPVWVATLPEFLGNLPIFSSVLPQD